MYIRLIEISHQLLIATQETTMESLQRAWNEFDFGTPILINSTRQREAKHSCKAITLILKNVAI